MIKFYKKLLTDVVFISGLIILYGLFHYGPSMLVISLAIGYLVANTFYNNYPHDYWSHKLYKPKNKIIKWIFDLSVYLWRLPEWHAASPRLDWLVFHLDHHRHWKYNDEHQWMIDNNPIWIQLLVPRLKRYNFNKVSNNPSNQKKMLKEFQTQNNWLLNFIDDNFKIINILFHVALLCLMGAKLYLFLVFIPIYVSKMWYKWFADIQPHRNLAKREDEQDKPIDALSLNPLWCYHKSHHTETGLPIGGRWKYFNPYYWFVTAFMDVNPKTKIIPNQNS